MTINNNFNVAAPCETKFLKEKTRSITKSWISNSPDDIGPHSSNKTVKKHTEYKSDLSDVAGRAALAVKR